jgi:isoleucyl-tRNA synthetase
VPTSLSRLPEKPDHQAIELEILDVWEREETFRKVRERNAGGPIFSFVDGPVTANKKLGVHTAWGRTLKDVIHRYRALRGFDQRFQNGWDCQGLWVEVGVERALGLNSKREIEEYGLERFARKCRESVVESSAELVAGCTRLGQWMDWANDYYTFSDTNNEYNWRFLETVHERGWLYQGHRPSDWCPRCGTSLSEHELSLAGVYQQRSDPSLFVRFPFTDGSRESIVIWTTTPWTLPANVAVAVKPDAEYGLRANGDWVAVSRYPDDEFVRRVRGEELVGRPYRGPFDGLGPGAAADHRVIPWDEVTLDQGTGVVHIAPGCGVEDFELGRLHDLPILTPVDEAGRFGAEYGWLHGLSTVEAADQIVGDLKERGLLVGATVYDHAYPHCWRCDTPLIFRIADDWFIAVDELRPKLLEANETVSWIPEYFGKRMADWLRNMSDWNISRRRYYGLPLPFYPCAACGHLTVVGSKAELAERAVEGMDQLEELHRPWIDAVVIRCAGCGEPVRRISEVGDVWLDAGIVPLSTLGWENPEWVERGSATGAAAGLTTADLPDHAYWQRWFPADWVSEMREQIRLWFYAQLFISVALVGRAPFEAVLGYEKLLDEYGREMHGSWGNMISADDAFEQMGADVMRWQFCAQPPDRDLLFGFGAAHEIRRKVLTLWNSARFFLEYAFVESFQPDYATLERGPGDDLKPLDRWLVARTHRLVADTTAAYDAFLVHRVVQAYESYVDDLSNWYIRRSRRRFWNGERAALSTLWWSLAQALRVISPVLPFLGEHLWRALVRTACEDAPESIFLAGWPEPGATDDALVAEIAEVRAIVELGRRARAMANVKLRQPLGRAVVYGAVRAQSHADEIAEELRVHEIRFESGAGRVRYKPNLRVLGPRLGKKLPEIRRALEEGRYDVRDGAVLVDGELLSENDLLIERDAVNPGWVVAAEGDLSLELDPELDDDLLLEGRVLELVHAANAMRKEQGLALTDRIVLTVPAAEKDLADGHRERIARETLATDVRAEGDRLLIQRV